MHQGCSLEFKFLGTSIFLLNIIPGINPFHDSALSSGAVKSQVGGNHFLLYIVELGTALHPRESKSRFTPAMLYCTYTVIYKICVLILYVQIHLWVWWIEE